MIKIIKQLFDLFLYGWIRVVIFLGVIHLIVDFSKPNSLPFMPEFLALGLLFWAINDNEGFKMMLRDITQKKGDKT